MLQHFPTPTRLRRTPSCSRGRVLIAEGVRSRLPTGKIPFGRYHLLYLTEEQKDKANENRLSKDKRVQFANSNNKTCLISQRALATSPKALDLKTAFKIDTLPPAILQTLVVKTSSKLGFNSFSCKIRFAQYDKQYLGQLLYYCLN